MFNDLEKQEILLDRRLTYRTLEEAGVPVMCRAQVLAPALNPHALTLPLPPLL